MSDLERLESCFADGRLVRPGGTGADLVDFSRALASLCGAPDLELSAAARQLKEEIGPSEHYVLVLIDGLGVEQLERCPAGGFLRAAVAGRLRSVFPSTTAAALTSLATGEYPQGHGVLAWWLRLPEHELTATILPFVERFSEADLGSLGVDPAGIFTVPSLTARLAADSLAVLPAGLVDTVYSTYSSGGTAQAGYEKLDEAFDLVAEHVLRAAGPTFTYLYLPQVDGVAHEDGCGDEKVLALLAACDELVAGLAGRLEGRARIVITGDHGMVDVPDERTLFLDEDDPLADLLVCPPSGERTVPFFHVRPGRGEEFSEIFRAEYGEHFMLLAACAVERLKLFGPGPLGPEVRARLGDFAALAPEPTTLNWRARDAKPHLHRGVHAGLSPAEMTVPLVLA